MRKLIDVDVILRYPLGNHPQMSENARNVIEKGAFTLPEVVAEVVYVLKGVYKIDKEEISRTLKDFFGEATIENQEIISSE